MTEYYIPNAKALPDRTDAPYVKSGQAFFLPEIGTLTAAWWGVADPASVGAVEAPIIDQATQILERTHDPAAPWSVIDRTLDQIKTLKKAEVEASYQAALQVGFPYDFGTLDAVLPDGTTADAGIQTFQLRNLEDRSNWQLALTRAQAASAGTIIELRMASNARVQCDPVTAQVALGALLTWGSDLISSAWTKKDQIQTAATVAAALAIDTTIV